MQILDAGQNAGFINGIRTGAALVQFLAEEK
jgi:hypothetical protein